MLRLLKSKKLKWLSVPIVAVLIATLLVLMLPVGTSVSSKRKDGDIAVFS